VLLLDSEAISSVAHGPDRRRDRVRALVMEMRSWDLPIATVAAVLAEVVRGRPADVGVFAGLRRERVEVHHVDSRMGVRAGQLLGTVGAGSEMAIDAFLLADADLRGGAVIATCDTDDLRRLATVAQRVRIADLDR
jgi:predicted nucleic acid-binding protein